MAPPCYLNKPDGPTQRGCHSMAEDVLESWRLGQQTTTSSPRVSQDVGALFAGLP